MDIETVEPSALCDKGRRYSNCLLQEEHGGRCLWSTTCGECGDDLDDGWCPHCSDINEDKGSIYDHSP